MHFVRLGMAKPAKEEMFVVQSPVGRVRAQCWREVWFLTDEKVKDKAEKVRQRNEKLAALSGDDTVALVVKAADRLANLRESIKPGEKNEKMILKYGGEHLGLRAAAYRPGLCDPIWSELDAIYERIGSG